MLESICSSFMWDLQVRIAHKGDLMGLILQTKPIAD
jgi:hypothetical protein